MGEPAINFSFLSHSASLIGLEAFAADIGDSALQDRSVELRTLIGSSSLQAAPTSEQSLVLNIQKKWEAVYGANIASWPVELKDSLETIRAGIGFASFNNNVISALQNLSIREETYPAFESGLAVVAKLALPDLAKQALQLQANANSGIIPAGATRAGLHFVSNPVTLVIPMWSAGLFGRATVGGVSAFGRFLGLANESAAALSVAASVPVEAAAFMGASDVVAPRHTAGGQAFMGQDGPINRATTDRFTEFTASTIFFSGLKLFGFAGTVAQSVLPLTELGGSLAKLTGHTTSILGLASMEKVQVTMGIAPVTTQSFYESLWRAGFLHATVQTTNGVVNVNGVKSNWAEVARAAESINGQIVGSWPVPVFAGNARQSTITLLADMQRAIRESMGKRGGNMPNVFLMEGNDVKKVGQVNDHMVSKDCVSEPISSNERGDRVLNNHKSIIVVLHPFPTSWDFIKEAHELGFEVWTSSIEGLPVPNDVVVCITHQLKSSVYEPEAIAREIGSTKVSLFYPGSEMAVISAAALSESFDLPGNSVETAMKSRYKDIMRKELEKIVPDNIPRYAIITDKAELVTVATKIGFPAVFKRTDFAGSFGIKVVKNIQELEHYFDEQAVIKQLSYGQAVRPIYLLEEYVAGQEFSVESITINGVTTVLGVTKKTVAAEPYFVEAKHEFPAQSFGVSIDVVNSLGALAKRVTEALGFQFCVSHFEAKWDSKTNRPVIMEVASRTGGDNIPKLLKYVIGMHTWYPIIAYLLGKPLTDFHDITFSGAASVQFAFLAEEGIFEGISNLAEIRAHPAHKQDTITGELGKYQLPTFTYRDRIGYFIGHSLDVEKLRAYEELVSNAKVIVRKGKATDGNK